MFVAKIFYNLIGRRALLDLFEHKHWLRRTACIITLQKLHVNTNRSVFNFRASTAVRIDAGACIVRVSSYTCCPIGCPLQDPPQKHLPVEKLMNNLNIVINCHCSLINHIILAFVIQLSCPISENRFLGIIIPSQQPLHKLACFLIEDTVIRKIRSKRIGSISRYGASQRFGRRF